MAFIRIPIFQQTQQVVTKEGRFTSAALTSLNNALKTLGVAINSIAALPDIQAAITAAQDAANNANNAAATTTAATNLSNSYPSGLTLSADDAGTSATITISAHTRVYGDGTSVSVAGGTVTGLAYNTFYYIYYDQPSRAGGSVTYAADTDASVAAQIGDRHVVGGATTPLAGDPPAQGVPVRPPGSGAVPLST